MAARSTALAIVLWGFVVPGSLWAQEPPAPAPAASPAGHFVGLDVFGGGVQYHLKNPPPAAEGTPVQAWGKWGFDVGATFSYRLRWLGITGSFGRQTLEDAGTYQLVVGPRFTTRWYEMSPVIVRGFAHVLGGYAHTTGAAPPSGSGEWVVGGGADLVLLRVQVDWVRVNLSGLPRNYLRGYAGGVVPLCLSGCRETDGLNLSGRPVEK